MNLEAIEQRVLAYLEQVTNPLVRIEVLHAHLADHGVASEMNRTQLKDFLTRHDLVRVIEPLAEVSAGAQPDAEHSGTYAIAKDRVPSQPELIGMMREQLDVLLDALRTAREDALEAGASEKLSHIDEAQRKAIVLRDKLGASPAPEPDRPDNVIDFNRN